jgi:hypothetical protein
VHVLHAAWEGWAIAPVAPRAQLSRRPALLRNAEAPRDQPPPRILRSPVLDADIPPAQQGSYRHETLYLDSVGRFGFAAVPGFEGWRSREFAALWASASAAPLQAFLSLYAIDYVALPSTLRAELLPGQGFGAQGRVADLLLAPPVDAGGERVGWTLVPTEGARPRAFVAPRWRWAARDQAIEATLGDGRQRDLAVVVLTGTGAGSPPDRDGLSLSPCRIDGYVPERVRLECDSPAGGYAVLADENAPGWTARVDGAEAPVLAADVLLRATAVPPGSHRVVFLYRTPLLREGVAISGTCWAGLVLLFWWRRGAKRNGAEQGPLASSGSARRAA